MFLRMALGARPGDVLSLVLGQTLILTLVAAVVGMALAYAAGRWMEGLLFGVQPGGHVTFSATAGIALLMTISGSLFPSLRAVRVVRRLSCERNDRVRNLDHAPRNRYHGERIRD